MSDQAEAPEVHPCPVCAEVPWILCTPDWTSGDEPPSKIWKASAVAGNCPGCNGEFYSEDPSDPVPDWNAIVERGGLGVLYENQALLGEESHANPIKAWHFLSNDSLLRDGSGPVRVGETYSISDDTEVKPCEWGMHASVRAIDALQYAPGSVVCRVEVWGGVARHGDPEDKIVGRHRKVLSMANGEAVLRKFARLCALDVVDLWNAPDVVLEYLKTGKEDMRVAAWAAAQHTARAYIRVAVWDAARVAAEAAAQHATRSVAWAAARDAARAADRAADRAAVREASWNAARGAARGIAQDVALEKQNTRLEQMLGELLEGGK